MASTDNPTTSSLSTQPTQATGKKNQRKRVQKLLTAIPRSWTDGLGMVLAICESLATARLPATSPRFRSTLPRRDSQLTRTSHAHTRPARPISTQRPRGSLHALSTTGSPPCYIIFPRTVAYNMQSCTNDYTYNQVYTEHK